MSRRIAAAIGWAALVALPVRLAADPTPPGTITVTVDPQAERRPVSDHVYGVNFASATQLADVGYPVNRWGGNRTTRYHWQLDVDNSAFDWFYQNYTKSAGSPPLPQGSEADRFVTETRAAGADVVLTLPSMGRVAGPDRQRRWSFSQALYGPQLEDECSYFPAPPPDWCQPDAGNGLCDPAVNTTGFCSPDGRITGNDPDATSTPAGAAFVESWLDFVATRVGPAGGGGVRFAALDNEPMLWNSTHADIHPAPATYDEVWQRGRSVAIVVKAGHPGIEILGPDTWGWCDLWTSAADAEGDCTDGPDRQAHGGEPFARWYLGRVCAYQQQTGVRLVDYLDVHYYPQSGEAFGGEEFAAIRLDSIRELDSPTYVSQSWIGANVRLVPRLKEWIAEACPGTKLAITEYAWGADDAPSAALAQAEVLAIFGREGVDLATRWVVPETGTRTEDSFRIFLDYDGAGSRVAGESVSTLSSDLDEVGAYAVRGPSDQLYVLLFNKETAARDVDVDVAVAVAGPAALWRFTPASPLGSAGTVPVAGNGFTLTLPARSATVAVLDIVSDLIFRDGVDSGTTRNWSLVSP
ncbi:MAG: endoglucanase [Thermoanaerobaculia bacterium]|nr:MAG: endoglucanase [Thermoanaerobaculia bacterium]MBZ0100689.1 glycoside hydrolase family 44 protein [Thermoanaerobaculia bacterium]